MRKNQAGNVRVLVPFSGELLAWFDAEAKRRGRSRSWYVADVLRRFALGVENRRAIKRGRRRRRPTGAGS